MKYLECLKTLSQRVSIVAVGILFMASIVQAEVVKVGGKAFTEQLLISNLTASFLQSKGYEVELTTGMGTAVLRKALINKQVDIFWEYTGTAFLNYHKQKFERQSPEFIYESVKATDAKQDIIWLNRADMNNTYAFAMRADLAREKGFETMDDMVKALNDGADLTLAIDIEFYKRPDGLKPLQKTYGFEFPRSKVKRMDPGLVYTAVKEGNADIGLVYTTDGRIPAFDLTILDDTKEFFPPYNLTPIANKDVLEKNPGLADHLNQLAGAITTDNISRMNAQIDVDKKSIKEVVDVFLAANNL
ncbi:MAG: glycine betaine ABC transporter substrate-binding protein [Arenicella sp.]